MSDAVEIGTAFAKHVNPRRADETIALYASHVVEMGDQEAASRGETRGYPTNFVRDCMAKEFVNDVLKFAAGYRAGKKAA